MLHRKLRQPALPSDRPELVARLEEVGVVEGAEIEFDLVAASIEDARSAGRAEAATVIHLRLAGHLHLIVRIDRRRLEKRAVIFPAIEAMADADPVGTALSLEPHLAAGAAARQDRHIRPPFKIATTLA
ncbi:hypothetical protein QWE_15117 [Agrobacterium albertimagni AOL15]|uniref:Uncharacterized protein n=1 Tax=Agrobacterium albertimagni AOL15 TaxID=1156935 RepID=K2PDD3_9HYPH|nr:hypothetical protein QWE_15117 [Agrobacterium albertimagni AOL15]